MATRQTIPQFCRLKGERKSVMLTAYDAPSARLVDQVADIILVGDTLGNVIQGRETTLGVTMDEMLYHTRLVVENTQNAPVIGDMPFLSYQTSARDAVLNAGRFLKEAGCHAVKLEGGVRSLDAINAIVAADIPVMGHIGYTPQSIHKVGNKKVQRDHERLMADAKALEEAGVFGMVLECVPPDIAADITRALSIPTTGIGAGPDCDGQVLVFHDLLGFNPDFKPSFAKRYFDFHQHASKALKEFQSEVVGGQFPGDTYSYRPARGTGSRMFPQ